MTDEEGVEWVRGTLRAMMARRRFTYAKLVEGLKAIGVDENERNLRNKVARGTFSAVFFVQCLEAMGLDALKLDMHEVMSRPEGEREFGSDVPQKSTARQSAEMQRILASIRKEAGMDEPQEG